MVVKFGLRTTEIKKEQHFILAYQYLVTSENNNIINIEMLDLYKGM